VGIDELRANFDTLSDKEKIDFLMFEEETLGNRLLNEVIENHKGFAIALAIAGSTGGNKSAIKLWKIYWEKQDNDYSNDGFFVVFQTALMQRVKHEEEIEKFRKELEAL
jgi:hypothetical protein